MALMTVLSVLHGLEAAGGGNLSWSSYGANNTIGSAVGGPALCGDGSPARQGFLMNMLVNIGLEPHFPMAEYVVSGPAS